MQQQIKPRLALRLAELAELSGLSIAFLRKKARDGALKTRKIGSAVIVLEEDARIFLGGSDRPKNEGGETESTTTNQ